MLFTNDARSSFTILEWLQWLLASRCYIPVRFHGLICCICLYSFEGSENPGTGEYKGLWNHRLTTDKLIQDPSCTERVKRCVVWLLPPLRLFQMNSLDVINYLPLLGSLNISRTIISDSSLNALQGHAELRSLNLLSTNVTDEGLRHLQGIYNPPSWHQGSSAQGLVGRSGGEERFQVSFDGGKWALGLEWERTCQFSLWCWTYDSISVAEKPVPRLVLNCSLK